MLLLLLRVPHQAVSSSKTGISGKVGYLHWRIVIRLSRRFVELVPNWV